MDNNIRVNGVDVRIYDVSQAADYCGGPYGSVSKWTINRWRNDGWLRYITVEPHRFIYTKEMLDECLTHLGYENRIQKEGN